MPEIPYANPLDDGPSDATEERFATIRAVGRKWARRGLWTCLLALVVLAFWGARDLDRRVRDARHDGKLFDDLPTWPELVELPGEAVADPGEDLLEEAARRLEVQASLEERAIVALRLRGLAVPVRGIDVEDLDDTFGDPRSGGRRHRAIDIVAPEGTPVLAADDGTITSKASGGLGGNYLFQTDDTGSFVYYYAHLSGWTWGLDEGDRVRRGDVLGFVGTTGNAPTEAPHLHFAIYKVVPGMRGTGLAINPWRVLGAE